MRSIVNVMNMSVCLSVLLFACNSSDEDVLVFIFEKNLVGISALMLVVFYRRLGMHMTRHKAIMSKHDIIHKTGSI